jgi:hypothetical protein
MVQILFLNFHSLCNHCPYFFIYSETLLIILSISHNLIVSENYKILNEISSISLRKRSMPYEAQLFRNHFADGPLCRATQTCIETIIK